MWQGLYNFGQTLQGEDLQKQNLERAQAQKIDMDAQTQKAVQAAIAGNNGKVTPELAATVMGVDPEFGAKLYQIAISQQKADQTARGTSNVQGIFSPSISSGVDGNGQPIDITQLDPETLKANLDPKYKGIVNGLLKGDMSYASLSRMKDKEAILQAVSMIDPDGLDTITNGSRAATIKSFGSGTDSKVTASLNQLMSHAANLSDDLKTLHNGEYDVINAPANWVKARRGDDSVTAAPIDINAVADEATTAFKGAGAAESQVQDWKDSFPVNGSPKQQVKAMQTLMKLVDGRLEAQAYKFETGTKMARDPMSLLSPKGQQDYQRVTGFLAGDTTVQSGKKSKASEADTDIPDELKAAGITADDIAAYKAAKEQ